MKSVGTFATQQGKVLKERKKKERERKKERKMECNKRHVQAVYVEGI